MTEPGDILEGADAIAAYMSSLGGRWTAKRVYHLVGTGWPIWRQKGVGLMARKSRIAAYIEQQEQKAMTGGTGSASAA